MKVSINMGSNSVHTGHGYACMKIISNLGKTDHSLLLDRAAPLEFNFCHPNFYKFSENTYKVGYTAWESTHIPSGWQEKIDEIDEMWVPNKFSKEVFSKFTDKEIYVFPHGVDETFNIKKRNPGEVLKFLHIGYPAFRKNAHETINTFLQLYAGRKDVHLTIKGYEGYDFEIEEDNITYIKKNMTYSELLNLMHAHDVLIYPSWGEGFGLIPLQAMATGMPVIMTDGWCDYKDLAPELIIKSELAYHPWQDSHPGKMFMPDLNHLSELILKSEKDIDWLTGIQFVRANEVHKKYNWKKVVEDHFNSVEARLML